MHSERSTSFPLLEQILTIQGSPLQPLYSTRDLAVLFGVSHRAIQRRIQAGQLTPRDLPGRAKFLAQDVEAFLSSSLKDQQEDATATRSHSHSRR